MKDIQKHRVYLKEAIAYYLEGLAEVPVTCDVYDLVDELADGRTIQNIIETEPKKFRLSHNIPRLISEQMLNLMPVDIRETAKCLSNFKDFTARLIHALLIPSERSDLDVLLPTINIYFQQTFSGKVFSEKEKNLLVQEFNETIFELHRYGSLGSGIITTIENWLSAQASQRKKS